MGEIIIEEMKEMAPATQPIMGGDLQAVGVNITERVKENSSLYSLRTS